MPDTDTDRIHGLRRWDDCHSHEAAVEEMADPLEEVD